jgi:glutamine synthetase
MAVTNFNHLTGRDRGDRLPEAIVDDPASVSAGRLRRMGIRRLPASLGESIHALERSTVLRDAMGDLLFDSFLASRRGEWEAGRKLDDETIVRAHRWRY